VDSLEPRAFSRPDTEYLRSYANLLAGAVERLRMAAETRRHAASLRESEERYRTLATQIPQSGIRFRQFGRTHMEQSEMGRL
jgi:GAF domain-containing protein